MNHIFRVNVLQSLTNLIYNVGGFRLTKSTMRLGFQLWVYLTLWGILQYQVHFVLIVEETKHRYNVLVFGMETDFYLSLQLSFNFIVDELLFVKDF